MASSKQVIVFRTRPNPEYQQELEELGAKMYSLATSMPGFISYKDFAAEDGEYLTLVEFDSAENLLAWRQHPEHVEAQRQGKERLFRSYHIQVTEIVREYGHSG